MEGSSAFQFGRAAYRAGLMSRRQLVADAWANLQFRLRGSNDQDTHELRDRISRSLAGTRVRDLERLGADVLAGVLPRIYPQMLRVAHEHQDAGRPAYIVTAASQELAEMLAQVLAFDGGIGSQFSEVRDGVYTGRPTGLFVYRSEKAQAVRQLAEREGLDLAQLLRLLRLGVRSADAPRGGSPGGGQPRPRAAAGGPGGELGDPSLRPAGPPAEDRRRIHRGRRHGRGREASPWPGVRARCASGCGRAGGCRGCRH